MLAMSEDLAKNSGMLYTFASSANKFFTVRTAHVKHADRDESLFPQPPALAGGAGAGGRVPVRQTGQQSPQPCYDERELPHRPGGKGGGGLPPPRGDPPPARGSGGGSA